MEIGTLVRGDRPWDESALSGTICAAPVLTIREKMQSVSALYPAPELNVAFGHLSKSRLRAAPTWKRSEGM